MTQAKAPTTPENLELWTLPDCYSGPEWSQYYIFLMQTRDSDSVTRSNFIRGLEILGGETETVLVVHERHWAVGWIEWIAIHQGDAICLKTADEIAGEMVSYPVLDENHWGELEWEEASEYWSSLSIADRVKLLSDAGQNIFSARHDQFPCDDDGSLLEALRS